jgi:cell volume regulation protein A
MTVPLLFALLGSVILVGFLANLLFRLTKIPSVLVLIAIGVVLGPVTGWIRHDALLAIAPFFGAIALLVILFEGGLELDVAHVIRHAPRTAIFTTVVFAVSMGAVAVVAHVGLGLTWSLSLMLGAILGATSPAICMPVVSGLSLRDDVKTVIKLESAMGEVLLIVSVVLLIQSHEAGTSGATSWIWGFARSLGVALLVATVAGVLWSRLVGWLGREPLSYMLTLGVTCLLYFVVEELGGSPAIAVLVFGLLLANMQYIAGRVGPHLREIFGIHVKDDQFVLGQFMVNITAELSFLVRTFFFVYLGLLLNLSELSVSRAAWLVAIFVALLVSRRLGMWIFGRTGASFSGGEWQAIMALQPRGLATAVVAFMPSQAGIAEAAEFPTFAFASIVLSNLFMAAGVLFAERRLRMDAAVAWAGVAPGRSFGLGLFEKADGVEPAAADAVPQAAAPAGATSGRPSLFSPARDFEDEPSPSSMIDWVARVSGLRLAERETAYGELLRASYVSEPLFWLQSALGAAICAIGLLLEQTTVVIGGALVVPVARSVLATGLALAAGDLYLLLRLAAKLAGFCVVAMAVSASLVGLVPLPDVLSEIVVRTRPTILDFLVSLFGGMSAAALVLGRRGSSLQFLPGAVVGLTLVPALCVMGFALTDAVSPVLLRQATLQFSANLFAAILGAAAILLALGIHRAARADVIQQWKRDELTRPLASAIFRRLGVEEAIGGSGSVRARVVVIGVFLLLLLTPLQLAFHEVRAELRARQAVARAVEMFNVPNRSAVIGSAISVAGDRIDVRLQVATNALFSPEDRAAFERNVRQDTGRDVRVDLVQTIADVGDAGSLRALLDHDRTSRTAAPPPTVRAALESADGLLSAAVRTIPLPSGARVVGVRGRLADGHGPALDVSYLAEQELAPDAQALLVQLVSAHSQVTPDRISLVWLPASLELRLAAGRLGDEARAVLRDVRSRHLAESKALTVTLIVGTTLPPAVADALATQVRTALELPHPPAVVADAGTDRRRAVLTIGAPLM